MKSIGNRIKEIRESNKLSQAQFANILKIAQRSISDYENDKQEPGYAALIKIIEVYKIDAQWLMTGTPSVGAKENPQEEKLLKIYRAVDDAGKDAIYRTAFTHEELVKLKKRKGDKL